MCFVQLNTLFLPCHRRATYFIPYFILVEAPEAFMTDNSAAEKAALLENRPEARQLLCHFHVAQAIHWLLLASHGVCPKQRKLLLSVFQKVLNPFPVRVFKR